MSTNAGTWFYSEPERNAYLISERLNATFWQARVVNYYWRCVQAEPPFRAIGYSDEHQIELEWVPGDWLAVHCNCGENIDKLVEAITQRILQMEPCLTYRTHDNRECIEWHLDGGEQRWTEIQGRGEFIQPQRIGPCAK